MLIGSACVVLFWVYCVSVAPVGSWRYSTGRSKCSAGRSSYSAGRSSYSAGRSRYSAGSSRYSAGRSRYSAGRSSYSAGRIGRRTALMFLPLVPCCRRGVPSTAISFLSADTIIPAATYPARFSGTPGVPPLLSSDWVTRHSGRV